MGEITRTQRAKDMFAMECSIEKMEQEIIDNKPGYSFMPDGDSDAYQERLEYGWWKDEQLESIKSTREALEKLKAEATEDDLTDLCFLQVYKKFDELPFDDENTVLVGYPDDTEDDGEEPHPNSFYAHRKRERAARLNIRPLEEEPQYQAWLGSIMIHQGTKDECWKHIRKEGELGHNTDGMRVIAMETEEEMRERYEDGLADQYFAQNGE